MFTDKQIRKICAAISTSVFVLFPLSHFGSSFAADYPARSVTLVSPYGAGGAADLAARTMANHASKYLQKELVVVIKAGAAGVTGSNYVAQSKPDGYTLLLGRVGSQSAVPALNKTIPYAWDDFTMLGLFEFNPFSLTVSSESGYKSIEDLKKAASSGKKLTYSSAGNGSLQHVAMVVLLDTLGLPQSSMAHVPFKGGGEANSAVLGGHVDIFFQNLSGVMGNIKSGKLRSLAVTSSSRDPNLPGVPTFKELGLNEMDIIVGWSAIYGPKNLPNEVVSRWTSTLSSLSKDKGWLDATQKLGSVPEIMSPDETKAFVRKQYEKFQSVGERLDLIIK